MSARRHPRQHIIDPCRAALDTVRAELGERQYLHACEFVSTYDEWLLGLEFAIDCLVEAERAVSPAAFDAFERAFAAMNRLGDDRLRHLRDLVPERNR